MKPVSVSSEIGKLNRVLVHKPGRELLAVTPSTRVEFLYDDIIELSVAGREHRLMVSVLERFCKVLEVRDLLEDILKMEGVREHLIDHTSSVVPSDRLNKRMAELPPRELVTLLVEGDRAEPGPIALSLNRGGYRLPPVPNLFFTRDIGMVINDSVVIGAMRHEARWTEEMLVKTLFKFHPALANSGILYDGSEERRYDYTVEGGDVHPLREDLIMVGLSDRSSPAAIDLLCELLFAEGKVSDVIVVVMPGRAEAIHLDMVFTQVDRGLCVASPPHFVGTERLPVLHRRKGSGSVRTMPDVFAALKEVGMPLEPILCGGESRAIQEREQWASGCNLFSLRPGLAIAYARNEATLDAFEAAGFRLVEGARFLTGELEIDEDERAIISIVGGELVRGGGGPRCMTMPLHRDPV